MVFLCVLVAVCTCGCCTCGCCTCGCVYLFLCLLVAVSTGLAVCWCHVVLGALVCSVLVVFYSGCVLFWLCSVLVVLSSVDMRFSCLPSWISAACCFLCLSQTPTISRMWSIEWNTLCCVYLLHLRLSTPHVWPHWATLLHTFLSGPTNAWQLPLDLSALPIEPRTMVVCWDYERCSLTEPQMPACCRVDYG